MRGDDFSPMVLLLVDGWRVPPAAATWVYLMGWGVCTVLILTALLWFKVDQIMDTPFLLVMWSVGTLLSIGWPLFLPILVALLVLVWTGWRFFLHWRRLVRQARAWYDAPKDVSDRLRGLR